MHFLSWCKTFSTDGKKGPNPYSLVCSQRIKGVPGCPFLLTHVAQHSAGSFMNHYPFLPILKREKMGLVQDTSILWRQTKELRAVLAATPAGDSVLIFYSSSIKNPLGNLAQRLSWQPQGGVKCYQGALIFLQGTWGFKMLSIHCNKFPR